jgi:hypothetical protein
VSILSSLGRRRHLDDDAIAALWCDCGGADSDSPSLPALDHSNGSSRSDAAHVATCGQCRARYEALADWLEDTRDDAIGEADDLFPPERLASQQAQILRRLQALERPARVIAFPRFSQRATVSRRGPQRWVAAGLAAGLILGLGAGELLDLRRSMRITPPAGRVAVQELAPISQAARGSVQPASSVSDDMFLYDAEAVSTSPRVEALQALDALTPRVRDVDQAR